MWPLLPSQIPPTFPWSLFDPATLATGLSIVTLLVLGGFVFQELGETALWAGAFAIGIVLAVGYVLMGIPARTRMRRVEADQPTS